MKKSRKRISLICLLLVCTIMVSITGCSAEVQEIQARNLMESISANQVDVPEDLSSKNADVTEYRRATGFEALVGYLYLSGRNDRLTEIMETAYNHSAN